MSTYSHFRFFCSWNPASGRTGPIGLRKAYLRRGKIRGRGAFHTTCIVIAPVRRRYTHPRKQIVANNRNHSVCSKSFVPGAMTIFKSPGQTVVQKSNQVEPCYKLAGGHAVLPGRANSQANHSIGWLWPRSPLTSTTWRELAEVAKWWKMCLELGENLSLVWIQGNSIQLQPGGGQTTHNNSIKLKLGPSLLELGVPFAQGLKLHPPTPSQASPNNLKHRGGGEVWQVFTSWYWGDVSITEMHSLQFLNSVRSIKHVDEIILTQQVFW